MFYFDPTYLLLIPGILLALWAQSKVQITFNKYSKIASGSGASAAAVARSILDYNGLSDVPVEMVAGHLTDHYDPSAKVLRLSESVYNSTSIAAIGVAAHEAGHAIQHQTEYTPLKVRSMLVPIAQIGSNASWFLILLGILMSNPMMARFGVILFSAAVLFQLVTLPVEYDASSRALVVLEGGGYLDREEVGGAKKVLNAAALTYLAAALISILQLIRLIILTRFYGGNDD
ncbi:MAG: zinc metallopeptidase [Peptococcaceae bacterium]|nr:zinc metallopeptidase [Peptococcaceae bacterium]